ncbi:MAG: hypothetical protein AUG17_02100 [Crenarchaeota archaeon 13_1_20CM_2_53_14]|nr:MAG: hypothetical protein AUI07_01850 [archaeon 13_2_20CM_2_53_6]OLE59567.1 MAG: hypothetical protein AUG17_02100 [Crenarchaeota archaeon 13_1_20CM_2_53_14]
MTQTETWQEGTRKSIREIMKDPIVSRLLTRSTLTRAQFETLLIDQLGHDLANKRLTRNEMARIMRNQRGISRGALNRTLRQARGNISEAIHTILLLGYGGLFESPSLAPFVEASEQLKSQTAQLRESVGQEGFYRASVEGLLSNLEEAFEALYGKTRDT